MRFEVTRTGLIEYDATQDISVGGFLAGRGTSTLEFVGYPVSLDARKLSYPRLVLAHVTNWVRESPLAVRLLPGSHSVAFVWESISFEFNVNTQGEIEYEQAHDIDQGGFLTGRGTTAMELVGFPIALASAQLSYPKLLLAHVSDWTRDASLTARLLPGRHAIAFVTEAYSFPFDVTTSGRITYQVDYDTSVGGFLAGSGTSTLHLLGYPIAIDATQLSYKGMRLQNTSAMWMDARQVQSFRLLPGPHSFESSASSNSLFSFSVTLKGRIDYGADFDPFFSGRGTETLVAVGFVVGVSAHPFAGGLHFFGIDRRIKEKFLRLLPGPCRFGYTAQDAPNFKITLGNDGHFAYDAAYDSSVGGFLQGAGTSSLGLVGCVLWIDGSEFQGAAVSVSPGSVILDASTSPFQPVALLPRNRFELRVGNAPPLSGAFALHPNGSVELADYYPFLELYRTADRTVLRLKRLALRQKRPCRPPKDAGRAAPSGPNAERAQFEVPG